MRIPRLFTDQPLSAHQRIELPRDSSHYLSRVLRLSAGAPVRVFNGEGGEYLSHISALSKNAVSLQLEDFSAVDNDSALAIHLGIGISKGERMDLVIQKATELGVTTLTPLNSARTEVSLKGERLEKRLAHWRRVSISACEQCGRNILPHLEPPQSLADWVSKREEAAKLLLHPGAGNALAQRRPDSVALLVGPEGGFTDQEVENAQANDFANITLGPRILRTETAPLAAISIVQHLWGDLN